MRWRWDGRGKDEFRSARKRLSGAAGLNLAADTAIALSKLRDGTAPRIIGRGVLLILPVHAQDPWSIVYARFQGDMHLGLHMVPCLHENVPHAAFDIAEARLDDPQL